MSKTIQYLYDADEAKTFANLAEMVLASKQNVGTLMREQAEMVRRLTTGTRRNLTPGSQLKPHEQCLLCGSVGVTPAKTKRVGKGKPKCWRCLQGFTRAKPWRLVRGKRVHVECWENNVMPE
jgi:hypothetical protein